MSEYRHEKECPYPDHPNPKDCTYCKLILVGYINGYRDGRRAAAKAVRDSMPFNAKDELYMFAMDVIKAAEGK